MKSKAKQIFIGIGYVALALVVVLFLTIEIWVHGESARWGSAALWSPTVIGLAVAGWLIAQNWKDRRLRAYGMIIGLIATPPFLIGIIAAWIIIFNPRLFVQ